MDYILKTNKGTIVVSWVINSGEVFVLDTVNIYLVGISEILLNPRIIPLGLTLIPLIFTTSVYS